VVVMGIIRNGDAFEDLPAFSIAMRRCRGEKEGKGDSREEPDEEAHGRWEDALTGRRGPPPLK